MQPNDHFAAMVEAWNHCDDGAALDHRAHLLRYQALGSWPCRLYGKPIDREFLEVRGALDTGKDLQFHLEPPGAAPGMMTWGGRGVRGYAHIVHPDAGRGQKRRPTGS